MPFARGAEEGAAADLGALLWLADVKKAEQMTAKMLNREADANAERSDTERRASDHLEHGVGSPLAGLPRELVLTHTASEG